MKYIKLYESYDNIKDNIEDILLNVLDIGLIYKIEELPDYISDKGFNDGYRIIIRENDETGYKKIKQNNELIDTILRLNSYLLGEDFKSFFSYLGVNKYHNFEIKNDKLIIGGYIIPDDYWPMIYHFDLNYFK